MSSSAMVQTPVVPEPGPRHRVGVYLFVYFCNSLTFEILHCERRGPYRLIAALALAPVFLAPFVLETLCPSFLIFYLRHSRLRVSRLFQSRRWRTVAFCVAMAVGGNVLVAVRAYAVFLRTMPYCRPGGAIVGGDFYGLQIDPLTNRLIATNVAKKSLFVFDLRDSDVPRTVIPLSTDELERIRLNAEYRELYHVDRRFGTLLVYDLDSIPLPRGRTTTRASIRIKRRSALPMHGLGSSDVVFDNRSRTIAVTREKNPLWILDLGTLTPLKRLNVALHCEAMAFDANSNRYVLSYFEKSTCLRCISPDGRQVWEVPAHMHQGGIALSQSRKELYLPIPLRRKILVYDTDTFEQKSPIPTMFGARGVACDESNDVLVVASLCTGEVEAFDLAGRRSLFRTFLGYHLREVCLKPRTREGFVSSPIGGLYRFRY